MAEKQKRPSFIEEARRKQIIESTIQNLAIKGFIHTSLADIAEYVNVTKGVISYHFDGKDELINATLDTIIQTQVEMRHKMTAAVRSAGEKFRAYFKGNKLFIEQHPDYMTALLELWASYSTPEARLHFNAAAYEPAREQLIDIFELGQRTGEFVKLNNRLMAGLVQGAIDGITFQWVFDSNKVDLDVCFPELLDVFEARILKS